jgi:hypothetical protein
LQFNPLRPVSGVASVVMDGTGAKRKKARLAVLEAGPRSGINAV